MAKCGSGIRWGPMQCPKCGYMMGTFDVECRRCKYKDQRNVVQAEQAAVKPKQAVPRATQNPSRKKPVSRVLIIAGGCLGSVLLLTAAMVVVAICTGTETRRTQTATPPVTSTTAAPPRSSTTATSPRPSTRAAPVAAVTPSRTPARTVPPPVAAPAQVYSGTPQPSAPQAYSGYTQPSPASVPVATGAPQTRNSGWQGSGGGTAGAYVQPSTAPSQPYAQECPRGGTHTPGKTDSHGRLHCAKCGRYM